MVTRFLAGFKRKSRPASPALESPIPAPAPATPFEPTPKAVDEVAHTLAHSGKRDAGSLARAAITTALRVNSTTPQDRRVPKNEELDAALQALLAMDTARAPLPVHRARPWEDDPRGAAHALLTAVHDMAMSGGSSRSPMGMT